MSSVETRRVQADWIDTTCHFPEDKVIHQLFEAQVKRTPDATAFIFETGLITYRQLNRRANQLAHYLRRMGVGPEVPVGLCIDRSPLMPVCILGTLKAGGAYVPMEPDGPPLRMSQILRDTNPPILMLQRRFDHFDDFRGRKIYVDSLESELNKEPKTNPPCLTGPENLLNIIYTSASTGKPKGVSISIRPVLNRLYWMWKYYPFRSDDVAVFHKSYALVAATWECFGGLLKGIPTLVLSRQDIMDPNLLRVKLTENKVSYLLATPPLLGHVLDQAERRSEPWSSLRLATTSAEPISPGLVRRWLKCFPGVPLLNLYGSTECSSNVTFYDTRRLPPAAVRVPIGRPFANNSVYILDEELQPVPLGEVGEMCVSGACLARGYHNLPELTIERFVQNPFPSGREAVASGPSSATASNAGIEDMATLYRTGDLARYLPVGEIELIGRKDNQVKVRGFRVELEDVESALLEHKAITRCAAARCDDPVFGESLAAYVVVDGDTSPTELRRFLRERLPDHMIPASFTRLEGMPLTANGKIDRRGLPPPNESWGRIKENHTAPDNELERIIHSVLQDVLDREHIGTHDYFLDMGLHSLLLVQVQTKLNYLLERDIPVIVLLQHATISALAEYLGQVEEEKIGRHFEQIRNRAEKRKTMRARQRRRRNRHPIQ